MRARGFASDNNAPVHPEVLAAIGRANEGHAFAYGDDEWSERGTAVIKEHFGQEAQAFFVLTGTGANVMGLQAVTKPYNSIICAHSAHIHEDECGAPERFTGCQLLACPTEDGRLRPEDIEPHLVGIGFEHHSQPRVVSISNTTELGTVYTPEAVAELADFCHTNDLLLHVDGARLANAAAALGVGLGDITGGAGVDLLSFGGTKNGMLAGECVVFFRPQMAEDFKYIRKQGMQLFSKMRYVSAQFEALLQGDLWLRNASHANEMAARLAAGLESIEGVRITQPVEANAVFPVLPADRLEALQAAFTFYLWDDRVGVARLMSSWDTTAEDVDEFVGLCGG